MEMKGLKDNRKDEKGKLEHSNSPKNMPKLDHSRGTPPSKPNHA